jgi:AraC family transcriptional regulator, transcriptional activator FtrA
VPIVRGWTRRYERARAAAATGQNAIILRKADFVFAGCGRQNRIMAHRRHRVACVLSDGMTSIGVAIANDIFGAPWELELGVPWYRYRVCTADSSPVRIGALQAEVGDGVSALSRADTVIIPGRGVRPPATELLTALRRASERGARMVSFCTGAYLLAEAGLLDGRPATTLWTHAGRFRERFPLVHLDPSVLYIDDGQVLTSAGNSAAADLALHIVRSDYGAEIANTVARRMVAPPHRPGGQAQYVETPLGNRPYSGDQLAATLEWAMRRLGQPLPVKVLAARSALSPRHFTRQFRQATGTTPHKWLLTQRLALAQRLLETTSLPIGQVATSAGFGTPAALRLQFQQAFDTSPAAYRQTFRSPPAG